MSDLQEDQERDRIRAEMAELLRCQQRDIRAIMILNLVNLIIKVVRMAH